MDALTIISCIASTVGVGGIIGGIVSRRLARSEQAQEEAEKARARENVLILSGLKATGALSYATAIALKRGYANGEVEKGVEAYESWQQDLDTFLMVQVSKK